MKSTYSTLAIFMLLASAACKKDNDKPADCRIVTIVESGSGGNVYNLTYNNDGKISTINITGGNGTNKVFTYNGNTIITTTTSGNGDFFSRDSITLDAKGRPLNIRQFFDEDGTNWTNHQFEYNGDDLQKIHRNSEDGNSPETSVATMQNGNMISLQGSNGTTTVDYYTDRKSQPGDFLELAAFIQYGISIYPHKNLVKTIAEGGSIINLNYDFNADGTIAKVTATATGGTVTSLTYQFQCN